MYAVWGADIPEENQMFVDIWEFRKQFYKAVDTDAYFDMVREAAEEIYQKYPTRMCHDLLWAVMHEFERGAQA